MNSKEYKLPNGKTAIFEYDACEIGKITLECMNELMAMITDRPQGKWISNHDGSWNCSECGLRVFIYAKGNYCPNCGARMKGADDE